LICHLLLLKSGSQMVIKAFFRIIPKLNPITTDNPASKATINHKFITQMRFKVDNKKARSHTMSINARSLKYLLGWLIAGTRGGPTRAKIIEALKETPQNANQLATALHMDYKTMRHHLEVLEKNHIITSIGDRYGATYFISQTMEENYVLFEEIVKKIGKK
jgi:DNA-binding transcriptional ArsR family regulator